MKKTLLAALLLMASAAVWFGCGKDEESAEGTGSIYGTVTDYHTQKLISGVNVTLKPGGQTTLTGSDGTYEFPNLKPDKYSLKFSKAGYIDLDDDYVIEVKSGEPSPRDVQLYKKMAVLEIVDVVTGNPISSLDFGINESEISKSFNLVNSGTVSAACEISGFDKYAWITRVTPTRAKLEPRVPVLVTVDIDRTQLSPGEQIARLQIVSNNGNNELQIFATGYGAPTVTTDKVSAITATTAKCGGNVTKDGGKAVTERGLCWGTSPAPSLERGDSHLSIGKGLGTFSGTLTGLSLNTVYYVRAYATNALGTDYGEDEPFTTKDGKPTVTIDAVSNITATSAVCDGSISSNGGFAISDKGLVWSTSQYPTKNDNNYLSLGSGDGSFTGSLTNLSMNTVYYVRAYATNVNGTTYSEGQKKFTTANGKPKVTTTKATLNGEYLVTGGNVTDDGGYPVTARGVCYGTTPHPDISNTFTHTENGTDKGAFTATIPVNKTETVYIRAYATNVNGTSYGDEVSYESEYVNLGLSSGTKWKNANSGMYSYDDAVETFGDALPTKEQWGELQNECTWKWDDTKKGYTIYGRNGKSIFLPAVGGRSCNGCHSSVGSVGSYGYYWSSTPSGSGFAWHLRFTSSGVLMDYYCCCGGFSVRLVAK